MTPLLVQIDQRHQGCTHDVGALVVDTLLEELFEGLHVDIVDDLGQHPQGVGLVHLVGRLNHVLVQTTDHHEHLVLVGLQFLGEDKVNRRYLDEDVDQTTETLSAGGVHLEELGYVEENAAFLHLGKVLTLVSYD